MPQFLRDMRIAVLLPVLFGVVLAILVVRLGITMVDAVGQRQEALMAAETAKAAGNVFVAIQNTRRERGPVRSALRGEDPAEAAFIASNQEKRDLSRPAVEAVIATCRTIECAPGFDVEQLDADRAYLDDLRPVVDKAFRVGLSDRPDGLADRWQAAATAVVSALETVSGGLDDRVRMVDPVIAEQIAIKNAAYLMRDAVGLDTSVVGDAMIAGEITPAQAEKLAVLAGSAQAGKKTLESLIARPGLDPQIRAAYDKAMDAFGDLVQREGEIKQALMEGQTPAVSYSEWTKIGDGALSQLVGVSMTALHRAAVYADDRVAAANRRLVLAGLLLAFAVALGIGGFMLMRNRVVRPMGRITEAMLAVAEGKLDDEVPFGGRRDEIGDLARALVVFKENAIERNRAEAMNAETQAQRDQRQKSIEAMIGEFDTSVSSVLTTVSSAATQLEQTARSMASIAETASTQSQETMTAAGRTSSNVQTIASATEEMSSSSSEIASQVSESARIAQDALREAEQTNVTVEELATSAHRIGEVVELINSIASQTNLLALNATIEAARAGEAGKGFAVVAGEVKALATETAKATEEITSQIAAMQTATGSAVEAIHSIRKVIEQVNSIAAGVSAAVEEQNSATGEISRNVQVAASGTQDVTDGIQKVTDAAKQAGGASDEVLSAASSLSRESETLRHDVESFLQRIRAA